MMPRCCTMFETPLLMQVEIYVEVDEVEVVGVSASSRINISSTATTDEASAMHTLVRYKHTSNSSIESIVLSKIIMDGFQEVYVPC